jgi:hypothetical protein
MASKSALWQAPRGARHLLRISNNSAAVRAEVATVLTGPRLFLRSDDRHAGIKKDEQQHEAAHKSPEGHTYQRLPEPHGPRDA